MGNITRLDQALACREAADWVRDPASPKVHHVLASTGPNLPGTLALSGECLYGNDPRATHWCALGRVGHILNVDHPNFHIPELVMNRMNRNQMFAPQAGQNVAVLFNMGRYEEAALLLDDVASRIEASLPTTTEDSRAVPVGEMVIA